jgi:hypothetical protein
VTEADQSIPEDARLLIVSPPKPPLLQNFNFRTSEFSETRERMRERQVFTSPRPVITARDGSIHAGIPRFLSRAFLLRPKRSWFGVDALSQKTFSPTVAANIRSRRALLSRRVFYWRFI